MKNLLRILFVTLFAALGLTQMTGCGKSCCDTDSICEVACEEGSCSIDSQSSNSCSADHCSTAKCSTKKCSKGKCSSGKCDGCDFSTDVLNVHVNSPKEVCAGQEFCVSIMVQPRKSAADVQVVAYIPEGTTYLRSDPDTKIDGNRLSWHWETLSHCDKHCLRVWLRAAKDGCYTTCVAARAMPMCCDTVKVCTPNLVVQKCGPSCVLKGDCVTYNITVTNKGDGDAKEVVLTDLVPEGLRHETGKKNVEYCIGTLRPCESRTIPISFTALERGRVCNRVVASACNCGKATAEACTNISCPCIEISKQGPKTQFMQREAVYQIQVKNTGDIALTNAIVTDEAPPQTRIVCANGASICGNTATWTIPKLQPGETKQLEISIVGCSPCETCNQVFVRTCEGCTAEAKACTLWKGMAAMLIETVDTVDPVTVGCKTTYKITVVNQGTAPDRNVSIIVKFPDGMKPVSAAGDSKPSLNGQTVEFAKIPVLEPHTSLNYIIEAKATAVGDQRIKAELRSDLLQTPVTEEESTNVY